MIQAISGRCLAPALAVLLCLAGVAARAGVDIQEVESPAGVSTWLVEDHTLPFVALELRFRGGASLDQPDKRGAVNLMTGLLEEGAADMDARAFARASDEIGAEFNYDTGRDAVSVSARFLSETRDRATQLLRASIVEPRFAPAAIERVRAQVLSVIRSNLKDPDKIARNTLSKMIYGSHPYGSSKLGTIESVIALTRDDILAAHRAVFARDRVYVSAVGDITPDQLSKLVDDLLGTLPAKGTPLPERATLNLPGGVRVVDFDTPQSTALFAQPGISRDDPDFFAAYVLNHIIGGGTFSSRLMTEVREKRGLTYGVYSYLANHDDADVWIGSVASANDRIAKAIKVIRAQWSRVRAEGVTQAELDAAKTYLTGAYPLRFDGNGPIANILAGMQMRKMPRDYIARRNDLIEAVTLADVNRVAKRLMAPEKLTFVVVGRPDGIATSTN